MTTTMMMIHYNKTKTYINVSPAYVYMTQLFSLLLSRLVAGTTHPSPLHPENVVGAQRAALILQ